MERSKRGCSKRGCKSETCGNMQHWPDLREIYANLRKLCLQNLRKSARKLRPRLLRYRLFLSELNQTSTTAEGGCVRPSAAPMRISFRVLAETAHMYVRMCVRVYVHAPSGPWTTRGVHRDVVGSPIDTRTCAELRRCFAAHAVRASCAQPCTNV